MSLIAGTRTTFAAHSSSYIVQPGDTARDIAQQYNVTVLSLATANPGVDLNVLSIGQTINLVPAITSMSSSALPQANQGVLTQSFEITPDGIVRRSVTWVQPVAPFVMAPYLSQFDGTIWAKGNCGPTSLAMALGALAVNADQLTLRNLANRQMGNSDPGIGTSWDSLAYAARQYGISAVSLNVGATYHRWTLDDLKREVGQNRPTVLLVRYWDLPDHRQSSYGGDHYILALGFDPAGNLIYHDSASVVDGAYRTMTPTQLLKAWTEPADGLVRTAMAFYKA